MVEARVVFLRLSDGQIIPASEGSPEGLYVKGQQSDDGLFFPDPQSEVEGEGPLGQGGSPGWMELSNGTFHGEMTARPPIPPFIRGKQTPQGFVPAGRNIER